MGGHQAGDVASRSAVQVISHVYYNDPEPDLRVSLSNAIKQANAFIYQEGEKTPSLAGMGTTVVATVIRGQELCLANVGDARIYLLRQGKVTQATRDHSFVADQVRAGLLTMEEARNHPQRNVITRALGSRPDVKVDTYSGELQAGDVLLMCTDGLSEYVHEEDMQPVLTHYPPEEAVTRLIALANSRGGSDNITALVIQAGARSQVATTQPLSPPAPKPAAPANPPAPRSRRRPIAVILGVLALVAVLAVALVAGLRYGPALLGMLGERATPTASLEPSPVASPEPSPTIAATTTLPPTTTPAPTENPPTTTPAFSLGNVEPVDGAVVEAGQVTFRWRPVTLLDQFDVVVQSEAGELCRAQGGNLCQAELPVGDISWWIEVLVAGRSVSVTDPFILRVRASETITASATVTSTGTTTSTDTLSGTVGQ